MKGRRTAPRTRFMRIPMSGGQPTGGAKEGDLEAVPGPVGSRCAGHTVGFDSLAFRMEEAGRSIKLEDGAAGVVVRHTRPSELTGPKEGIMVEVETSPGKIEKWWFEDEKSFYGALEGTWKVIEYAGPMHDDHVYEFDRFEDALEKLRCGYPFFIKMERPDGTPYEPEGKEWETTPLRNMLVLRKGPFSASQNWTLNRILEDKGKRMLLHVLLAGIPFSIPCDQSVGHLRKQGGAAMEDAYEVAYTVLELLAEDILELVPCDQMTGPLDTEHHLLADGKIPPRRLLPKKG